MRRQAPDPDCEICGGTGEYETPHEERAGEIIGGNTVPCPCTKNIEDDYEKDEDDDSDSADSGDSEGEDTGF